MTANARWPLVIVASALVVAILTILDASGPLLALPALWFLLVCIGMAFLPLAGIKPQAPLELALIPLFSIVLDSLVATALTLAGALSETSALVALIALALVGCALQLLAASIGQVADSLERLGSPAGSRAREPVSSGNR